MRKQVAIAASGAGLALIAGAFIAPNAQATEAHSCKGGYVKYTSRGDYLTIKDTRADGRIVYVNMEAPNHYTTYMEQKGKGHSVTFNLNIREHRTVKLYVSLVKGDPSSDNASWKTCTSFKTQS